MKQIRVLLADDHPVTLAGISDLIQDAADMTVVGEASNGIEALELTEREKPDVLLLDIDMPKMSGVDVAKRLKRSKSPTRILVFSGYDDIQFVGSILAIGVSGYLTKCETPEMILRAIRGVARGERVWISHCLADKLSLLSSDDIVSEEFTERQWEVLRLIIAAKTNYEIGRVLNISERTVEKHVGAILGKLGATSRVGAAIQAIKAQHPKLRA